jgi:hypothetical protein
LRFGDEKITDVPGGVRLRRGSLGGPGKCPREININKHEGKKNQIGETDPSYTLGMASSQVNFIQVLHTLMATACGRDPSENGKPGIDLEIGQTALQ